MANPFWSQELQDRFALEQARPEDLPLVPEGDSGVGGVGESEEMIPDARDLLNLLSFDADQENVEEKSLDDGNGGRVKTIEYKVNSRKNINGLIKAKVSVITWLEPMVTRRPNSKKIVGYQVNSWENINGSIKVSCRKFRLGHGRSLSRGAQRKSGRVGNVDNVSYMDVIVEYKN
ncbi:unnamed protein product [Durusdinium trenchii]|uniref:Uncharacterized protein n=1 Tax=Durusdinium trenchii TaxID=1381693 RepID=A0ABP0IZ51_9DINO